ncbi:helix-turn-helix transcriptional regulator [Methanosphaerula palustris]|nr:helix-turn-helix transcriptional regulator [Methanosphaerula palustris]
MPEDTGIGRLMKNRIKVFRAMNDLTQENLGRAIGVNRQTILAIEKGQYVPSLDLAFRIARYFSVNIEEMFLYVDDPLDQ